MNKSFEEMISNLDIGLFAKIPSQTSHSDKISLMSIQNTIRKHKENYIYLEIGSYLGGSIQPHLLDPKCKRIYSIDKRSEISRDVRFKKGYKYHNNFTKTMLKNLKQISNDLNKIICFDDDASNIDKSKLIPKPDFCFIDAEHTNKAIFSDFNFCFSILNNSGVIVIHDSDILLKGIKTIIHKLKKKKIKFRAYYLRKILFVIEINNYYIHKDNQISSMIIKPTHKTRNKFFIIAFKSRFPSKIKNLIMLLHSILKNKKMT